MHAARVHSRACMQPQACGTPAAKLGLGRVWQRCTLPLQGGAVARDTNPCEGACQDAEPFTCNADLACT